MARYHAAKCPTPVRWSRPNVAVSDGIGRVARVSWTRDYLFEGVKECVILLWVVGGEIGWEESRQTHWNRRLSRSYRASIRTSASMSRCLSEDTAWLWIRGSGK